MWILQYNHWYRRFSALRVCNFWLIGWSLNRRDCWSLVRGNSVAPWHCFVLCQASARAIGIPLRALPDDNTRSVEFRTTETLHSRLTTRRKGAIALTANLTVLERVSVWEISSAKYLYCKPVWHFSTILNLLYVWPHFCTSFGIFQSNVLRWILHLVSTYQTFYKQRNFTNYSFKDTIYDQYTLRERIKVAH